jgi:transposase
MSEYQLLTELLGLANVRAMSYQLLSAERIEVFIESSMDTAMCPDCHQISTHIHDTAERQTVRDLPIWDRQCWLRYAPRRFACTTCHDTFVEQMAWREPGTGHTLRYGQHIYQRVRRESIAQVAQDEGVSQDMVQGIFDRWAKKRSHNVGTRA